MKFTYYSYDNKLIICTQPCENLKLIKNLKQIEEREASTFHETIFFITNKTKAHFSKSFIVSQEKHLFLEEENIDLIFKGEEDYSFSPFLKKAIAQRRVVWLNSAYEDFYKILSLEKKHKWTITLVGLGDVGGILLTGLRLLGKDVIGEIKIFDKDYSKIKRWEYEGNAILSYGDYNYPKIVPCQEEDLFNTDMFIFCVTAGIPEVGQEQNDVRLVQLKNNGKIISYYSKKARTSNFKGIFSVVSDPVDQLCKIALDESNKNSDGIWDYQGLSPNQIRGYGLGVMNARAAFYSNFQNLNDLYSKEGRAFGPHGEGLIIANSIKNYNHKLSLNLTEKTKNSNLEVRGFGFKPYIAPALSSGAISIIATLKSEWHYSSFCLGNTFMGMLNRWTPLGTEFECYQIDKLLSKRIKTTYSYLQGFKLS